MSGFSAGHHLFVVVMPRTTSSSTHFVILIPSKNIQIFAVFADDPH